MKKLLIGLIAILVVASIGLNIYFLNGRGISIDRSVTNHQEQFQQQWQGQLLINQWTAQGNAIEWKKISFRSGDFSLIQAELNKLHPISALYSKVIYNFSRVTGEDITILYPDIFIKTKEEQIK